MRVPSKKFILVLVIISVVVGPVIGFAWRYVQQSVLLSELRPVSLKNCQFARFGGKYDGGYLLCENLLQDVKSAYSYGINGEDNWGYDVAKKYNLIIHQYDCFNTQRPVWPDSKARAMFHEECVGGRQQLIDNRSFDTVTNQIAKNGDRDRKLLVKMDVEGAEWDSLLETADAILKDVDQLVIEFHGISNNFPGISVGLSEKHRLIQKLKALFYVVNVHFNNYACNGYKRSPFPAEAFQVVFVSKRLGDLDPETKKEAYRNPLESPDNQNAPDCQVAW